MFKTSGPNNVIKEQYFEALKSTLFSRKIGMSEKILKFSHCGFFLPKYSEDGFKSKREVEEVKWQ